MTPSLIRAGIVSERVSWIRGMIRSIRALPTNSFEEFVQDPRNTAAAESYLRRGIEALLDLGRHILAKGFAIAATEYKDIGKELFTQGILTREQADLLRRIAGYRNRMVHFYHEVDNQELYSLSTSNLEDLEELLDALLVWLRNNPDQMDQEIQ